MKTFLAFLALVLGAALVMPTSKADPSQTVTGKWHFVFATDGGDREFDPVFQQDGDKVTGKWGASDVKGTFADGKLNLEFPMTSDEAGPGTLKIKGQLAEDTLTGDWGFLEYSGSFKATRTKE